MEQVNPYAAPKADVYEADFMAPLSLSQMLFSFDGRIRRSAYWLYAMACSLVFIAFMAVVGFGLGLLLKPESMQAVIVGLTLVLYLPLLYVLTALQAKRWHDRGRSAWWMLIAFVPIANFWGMIEVGFLPGTPGRNAFGPPPR